ncbi:MAG: hypothetical protein ACOC5M_03245, partial [Chloroflexota bacterium]
YKFYVDIEVSLSSFASYEDLAARWREEAESAMAAINAGALEAWKAVGEPEVHVVMDVEAASEAEASSALYSTLYSLPMAQKGVLTFRRIQPVQRYEEWARHLGVSA